MLLLEIQKPADHARLGPRAGQSIGCLAAAKRRRHDPLAGQRGRDGQGMGLSRACGEQMGFVEHGLGSYRTVAPDGVREGA
jgi:hypothetical protein